MCMPMCAVMRITVHLVAVHAQDIPVDYKYLCPSSQICSDTTDCHLRLSLELNFGIGVKNFAYHLL